MNNQKERKQTAVDSDPQQDLAQKLGQRLVKVRTEKNIDLMTIANRLRLQPSYLEALDSGDWHILPDKVYAMGFLRQYAEVLDIDISKEIKQLKSGVPPLKASKTIADPGIIPSKHWFRIMLILFVAAFVMFNIFYVSEQDPDSIDHIQPLPQSMGKATDAKDSTPSTEKTNTLNTEEETKAAIKKSMTLDTQMTADITGKEPLSTTIDTVQSTQQTNIETVQPSQGNNQETQPTPVSEDTTKPTQANMNQFQFSAHGQDVWIKVTDAKNKILLSTLIPSGSTKTIQNRSSVYLTCGNAIALAVDLNGKRILSAGELGKLGQVIRRYKIGVPTLADE